MSSGADVPDAAVEHSQSRRAEARADQAATSRLSLRLQLLAFFGTYGTLVALGTLIIIFSSLAPSSFATFSNARNVITDLAPTMIIAAGLTVPLITNNFDLSIGYHASFACVMVVGLISNQGLPIPLAILVVLMLGVVIGLINGFIVTKLGVNAFIATLGTGTLIVGLNYAYTGGVPVDLKTSAQSFVQIGLGSTLGIPNPIIIMLVVLALAWYLLNVMIFSQHFRAVGDDPDIARRYGIRVDGVRIAAFAIAGVCAAATGILTASVLGSGDTTAGDAYMLQAYAAAFLGSAALRDGQFHVVGTAIGVITVAVGFNGLAIVGTSTFAQYMLSGGLLVVAVALSTLGRRYARSGG